MRLATIATPDGLRAAVLADGAARLLDGFADVGELLRADGGGLGAAERTAAEVPYEAAALRRPVTAPAAVVCVGLNYRTHIVEMGRELPRAPTLFAKLARALADPYAEVVLPAASAQFDYEGELAIVIGRGGRDVPRERAWEHVAGLTLLNDVTARDFQRRSVQWFAGKTFEASSPFGPAIVTLDELPDLGDRELVVRVNGEERQRAPLGDLVFDVPALVADLSRIVALQPGDVIATGTPGGVGEPQERFLRDGDEVEVEVAGIGSLRNAFRSG